MKRLTERDEYGNADIIALSDIMPEVYAGLSFDETNALTDALNRLATYEDTGLEPSEINELLSDIEKLLKFPRFVEAMMRSGDKALEDY